MLKRSDIRPDPSSGVVSPGVPLKLSIRAHDVTGSNCSLITGALIDLWHCDAAGLYSDEDQNNTRGRKFLRGYQVTDDKGAVEFTTIYPGWYHGRTVHIHVRVRTYSGSQLQNQFTSQYYFDDEFSDHIFAGEPYNQRRGSRDLRNKSDMVLRESGGTVLYLEPKESASGLTASIDMGVDSSLRERGGPGPGGPGRGGRMRPPGPPPTRL